MCVIMIRWGEDTPCRSSPEWSTSMPISWTMPTGNLFEVDDVIQQRVMKPVNILYKYTYHEQNLVYHVITLYIFFLFNYKPLPLPMKTKETR